MIKCSSIFIHITYPVFKEFSRLGEGEMNIWDSPQGTPDSQSRTHIYYFSCSVKSSLKPAFTICSKISCIHYFNPKASIFLRTLTLKGILPKSRKLRSIYPIIVRSSLFSNRISCTRRFYKNYGYSLEKKEKKFVLKLLESLILTAVFSHRLLTVER